MTDYNDLLKQHWLVVCKSKALKKEPLACQIMSLPIVLFRGKKTISALLDRCVHRNVALSKGKVTNGLIHCPYHGWQFDEKGRCQKIPGRCKEFNNNLRHVDAFEVKEEDGLIWLKISEAKNERYSAPFIKNKHYDSFIWHTEAKGSLVNIIENFLDATHTHFVHSGLIRTEGKRQKVIAQIKRRSDQVEVKYIGEGKQSGIISRYFEKNRKESYGRFILPSVAEIQYASDSGIELSITAYLTPTIDDKHTIHAVISMKKGIVPGRIKQWVITPFFKKALKQDMMILESQYQNISHFGKEDFVSTEMDLIRPHIEILLRDGINGKATRDASKSVALLL